jgi:hypothetical protein
MSRISNIIKVSYIWCSNLNISCAYSLPKCEAHFSRTVSKALVWQLIYTKLYGLKMFRLYHCIHLAKNIFYFYTYLYKFLWTYYKFFLCPKISYLTFSRYRHTEKYVYNWATYFRREGVQIFICQSCKLTLALRLLIVET